MSTRSIIIMILRILAVTAVMCATVTGIFYLYSSEVPKALAYLEGEGKMENTIWVVQNFVPMLTVAGLIAALYLMYRYAKLPYLQMQKEKGWVMLLVAVFTYGVILPYVLKVSQGCFLPVPEGEEDVSSLLENTVSWFVIQIIPFMITVSYHFTRAAQRSAQADITPIQNGQEDKNEE